MTGVVFCKVSKLILAQEVTYSKTRRGCISAMVHNGVFWSKMASLVILDFSISNIYQLDNEATSTFSLFLSISKVLLILKFKKIKSHICNTEPT